MFNRYYSNNEPTTESKVLFICNYSNSNWISDCISIVGIVTTTVAECNTRCPIVTIATATASKTPSNCHNRPFDRCSSHLLQANLYLNLILSLGLQHRSYTQTEVPVNILRLSNTYNDCHRSIANVARVPSFPCSGEPRYRIHVASFFLSFPIVICSCVKLTSFETACFLKRRPLLLLLLLFLLLLL